MSTQGLNDVNGGSTGVKADEATAAEGSQTHGDASGAAEGAEGAADGRSGPEGAPGGADGVSGGASVPEVDAGKPSEVSGDAGEAREGSQTHGDAPDAGKGAEGGDRTSDAALIAAAARIGRGRAALTVALEEHRPFHSGFQIDRFIVGTNAFTPWAGYTQVAREINTRVEALKLDYIAAGRLQIKRAEQGDTALAASVAFDKALAAAKKRYAAVAKEEEREAHIAADVRVAQRKSRSADLDVSETTVQLDTLRRTIADRERELGRLLEHFVALRTEIDKGGPLTPERREKLEAEAWIERLRIAIATEIVTLGAVTSETFALVLALPTEERPRLVGFSKVDAAEAQAWLLERDPTPKIGAELRADEVRNLLCS